MAKRIIVNIDDNGRVNIKFEGYEGDECVKERVKILSALRKNGLDIDEGNVKFTDEFYDTNTVSQKQVVEVKNGY